MKTNGERQIVEAARKDPKAFGVLFDKYHGKILKYAVLRSGNAETGRDIASETFFKAQKNLWKFRWMGMPFSAWLYRIAGNLVNDYFRLKKHEPMSLEAGIEEKRISIPAAKDDIEAELAEVQEKLDNDRQYGEIIAGIMKLPVNYQEVLVLKYMEGHKTETICGILGKKSGTVKSLISRGLTMLREQMQPNESQSVKVMKVKKEDE